MSPKTSLRLLTSTPAIPVPPTLRHSPYLTSPIFRNDFALPAPSEEAEKWLQDTVPISPTSTKPNPKPSSEQPSSPRQPIASLPATATRPRLSADQLKNSTHFRPSIPSPPLFPSNARAYSAPILPTRSCATDTPFASFSISSADPHPEGYFPHSPPLPIR